MTNISLIGTGHLGSAIAKLHYVYHLEARYQLSVLTKSTSKLGRQLYGSPLQLSSVEKLTASDIIILAIPADKTINSDLWGLAVFMSLPPLVISYPHPFCFRYYLPQSH